MRLPNVEKEIAREILGASNVNTSKLGLRFDRVVSHVLGDLRTFAERTTPEGLTVLLAVSAPIRLPAKTANTLEREILACLAAGVFCEDRTTTVHGNEVRIRIAKSARRRQKLVGFVHNRDVAAKPLLDLAERRLGVDVC